MGAGHGWAMMLDDEDITQLLPMCGDDFEAMVRTLYSYKMNHG